MDLTFDVWKQQASARLRQFGGWIARRKTQDAPYLVYGALCGMSLWPLVEAARTGDLMSVGMALGSVAGAIGTGLIGKQIQRWVDSADEVAVEEWVAEKASANAELRAALDDILEKLDAVTEARDGLGESDRRWFTETLRGELAQLGNLGRFADVLVEGSVYGDVVTGTKITMFDQRNQNVRRQTNVAGDWRGQQAPDGDDDD